MSERHETILKELTSLPTGAGLESRVIKWIERWAKRRKAVTLTRDTLGNLTIKRKGARSKKPIYFTAHLDHPAFAVTDVLDHGKTIQAEFRGGVHDAYFEGSPVSLHLEGVEKSLPGKVISLDRKRGGELFQLATIELKRPAPVSPGSLVTWALPKPKVAKGLLHAPLCDDLAAAAAAICAFERLLAKPEGVGDVRLLFTLCEEVGFIGAIGVAKAGGVPKDATLICLENSKSMVESPIGDGPIIRVGDRISIFDPELTARLVAVAEALGKDDEGFQFQRKLMPGGACEATAFRAYGYLSSCICLPLGNYHNMDEANERIAPEIISIDDYHMLVRLLEAVGRSLPTTRAQQDLVKRLDGLFDRRRGLLD
jgi:endoglucanase